jgi:hypothetical protein
MTNLLRSALVAAVAMAPAAAFAQFVIPEPPLLMEAPAGPLGEEDAAVIAMMHGIAVVEDVDTRIWDGNFEVEGTDVTGEDMVITIDHDTGEVLEIDD